MFWLFLVPQHFLGDDLKFSFFSQEFKFQSVIFVLQTNDVKYNVDKNLFPINLYLKSYMNITLKIKVFMLLHFERVPTMIQLRGLICL